MRWISYSWNIIIFWIVISVSECFVQYGFEFPNCSQWKLQLQISYLQKYYGSIYTKPIQPDLECSPKVLGLFSFLLQTQAFTSSSNLKINLKQIVIHSVQYLYWQVFWSLCSGNQGSKSVIAAVLAVTNTISHNRRNLPRLSNLAAPTVSMWSY